MRQRGAYGEAIRVLRRYRGVSQEAMSPVIARRYLGKLELGEVNPSVAKLEELGQALDASMLTVCLLAVAEGSDELDDIVAPALELARKILESAESST